MPGQRADDGAGFQIPELDRAVGGGGGEVGDADADRELRDRAAVSGQRAELLFLAGIPDRNLSIQVAGDEAVAFSVEMGCGNRRPGIERPRGTAVLQPRQLDDAAPRLGEQAPVGAGVLLRVGLRRAAARGEDRDGDRERPQASSTGRPDLAEA